MASTSKYVPPEEFVEPIATGPVFYVIHQTEPMDPIPVTWAQVKQLTRMKNYVEDMRLPINGTIEEDYVEINSLRDILRLTAATATYVSCETAVKETRKNLEKCVEDIQKVTEANARLEKEVYTLEDQIAKQRLEAHAGDYAVPILFNNQFEYAKRELQESKAKYDKLQSARVSLALADRTAITSRDDALNAVMAIAAPYSHGDPPHHPPVAADLVYIINLTDAANFERLCEDEHKKCPVLDPAPMVCPTCGLVNLIESLKECIMQCPPNEILIATDQPLPPVSTPVITPPQPTPAPAPQPTPAEEEAESEESTSEEEEPTPEEEEEESSASETGD